MKIKKKEILFSVGMRDNSTDEKIYLKVWAETGDEATKKMHRAFQMGRLLPLDWNRSRAR